MNDSAMNNYDDGTAGGSGFPSSPDLRAGQRRPFGRLREKVALITGGSGGIGLAIAQCFAAEGARVVIAARDSGRLREAQEQIAASAMQGADDAASAPASAPGSGQGRPQANKVRGIVCDVSDAAAVRAMSAEAEAAWGSIDILVNNAGYFPELHPIQEMSDEQWDYTLRANLSSAFYVSRAVLPGMLVRRQGSVIMISSSAAKLAYGLGTPYSAAKAGMLGLMRALAGETGPYGVRVNALCPGLVQSTEMFHRVNSELKRATGLTPEARLSATREASLLRKILEPGDVAGAALFLACDDATAITGQTMNVDGGIRWD